MLKNNLSTICSIRSKIMLVCLVTVGLALSMVFVGVQTRVSKDLDDLEVKLLKKTANQFMAAYNSFIIQNSQPHQVICGKRKRS